ncbi:hypothetical protein [Halobaculum litoreum]|uniref:Uncharacterized protein n=1 Tax=Halobaculum litoreum TaxID=3031998 RepID=A0ABD5XNF9_9EURY|nr:hypothetical protein [Halobaculum sp. DT92]
MFDAPLGGEPHVSGEALAAVVADPAPPSVPASLPVPLGTAHLDASAATVRERLDGVPASFDAAAVPNGVVREQRHGRASE